ncbi:MAG: hypothetical protein HeimC3_50010 [Candidatus Heimdallarchaeota archaeon LC_3]|nr:MAG: hypothetical protein HeimC3_50010 [Candidatus Heimdallarchaeota archaeon LC_3]
MVYCPKCGNDVGEAEYCIKCGTNILQTRLKKLEAKLNQKSQISNIIKIQEEIQKVRKRIAENNEKKLLRLINKANSIPLKQFKEFMEFSSDKECLDWIISLSDDSPIRLDGNLVIFKSEERNQITQRDIGGLIQTCFFCGAILNKYDKTCIQCSREILHCPICKGSINFGEQIGKCSHCENFFHYSHASEWIKIKGKCAICNQEMNEEDLIIYYEGKGKK